MPCIWGFHNNSQIFLEVGIIDASSWSAPMSAGAIPQIAPPTMFKALVDTGCQTTMISSNVVAQLGLFAVGKAATQGIGPTVTYHNAYLFHVAFVIPIMKPGQIPVPGVPIPALAHILPTPVKGGEIASTHGFDVLLGMDILSFGSLKIEGSGNFSFSF